MTQSSTEGASRPRRFTYANVASTLALLVALGGGGAAMAAVVAKNSVGSPQIKNQSIRAIDIKNDAVRGPKVRNDSLKGADVDESSLGQVPDALNADVATTAVTSGFADVAGRANNVLRVTVSAAGVVTASSGGITATRVNTGVYNVVFDRLVDTCSYVGSIGRVGNGAEAVGFLRFAGLNANPSGVFVQTSQLNGALADRGFSLAAIC